MLGIAPEVLAPGAGNDYGRYLLQAKSVSDVAGATPEKFLLSGNFAVKTRAFRAKNFVCFSDLVVGQGPHHGDLWGSGLTHDVRSLAAVRPVSRPW